MTAFVFESYEFADGTARFHYRYDTFRYTETVTFATSDFEPNSDLLDRTLFLAFITVGTSYYKAFPTRDIKFEMGELDEWQAAFCNTVYQEGLSQFAYENDLTRDDLAQFVATTDHHIAAPLEYSHEGVLALQSGGKDSLVLATLLESRHVHYTPWYVSNSETHPAVLDDLAEPLITARRAIDRDALRRAQEHGARNGHVPVTYIVTSLALIQAILLGKNTILTAIGHEGEEPHAWIGDLAVNHQWSKTWSAEQLFTEYVQRYISRDILIGSPLRQYSELRIAELFATRAWERFGTKFSSCNVANYQQGADNHELQWCGECPKCANSYLLFAPFVDETLLDQLFHGDMFTKPELVDTYKGLLGVDGVVKPFECVGEIDELRAAYHMALGDKTLPLVVPDGHYDWRSAFPHNPRCVELLAE